MEDLVNLLAILVGLLAVVLVLRELEGNRRTGAVGVIGAFILGMAFHSVMLHMKIKYGLKYPWDHPTPIGE